MNALDPLETMSQESESSPYSGVSRLTIEELQCFLSSSTIDKRSAGLAHADRYRAQKEPGGGKREKDVRLSI